MEGRLDDPELALDQGIFWSHKRSEAKLDTKDPKRTSEGNEERSNELGSHQESGDTGPAVEQESPERSIPGKERPDPSMKTDRGKSSMRPKELKDHSQQAAISGSVVKTGAALRKTPHRCSPRATGQEPLLSSQPAASPQPPAAPPAELPNETDTKEAAAWLNPRTGQEGRGHSQQSSGASELKSFSALLQPSSPEPQTNQSAKQEEQSLLDRRKAARLPGETATDQLPAAQESSHSGEQWEKPELPSGGQPEDPPLWAESLHLRPGEWHLWWNHNERPSGQALGPPRSPYLQPTSASAADLKVEQAWLSPKAGRDTKGKNQPTNLVREVSETPHAAEQDSWEKRDDKLLWQLRNIGSKTNRQMTLSYTEGEEDVQPTYSVISLEEGTLLNRRTRKILTNSGQQTSETLLLSTGGTLPESHREPFKGATGPRSNSASTDSEQPEGQDGPQGTESERPRTPSQQSYNESQESGYGSQSSPDKDSECDSEYAEPFPSSQHLSEETLFRIESCLSLMAAEEEALSVYEGDSEKEGSFINRSTGKALDSHCLQTEESSLQRPGRCKGILVP